MLFDTCICLKYIFSLKDQESEHDVSRSVVLTGVTLLPSGESVQCLETLLIVVPWGGGTAGTDRAEARNAAQHPGCTE